MRKSTAENHVSAVLAWISKGFGLCAFVRGRGLFYDLVLSNSVVF